MILEKLQYNFRDNSTNTFFIKNRAIGYEMFYFNNKFHCFRLANFSYSRFSILTNNLCFSGYSKGVIYEFNNNQFNLIYTQITK